MLPPDPPAIVQPAQSDAQADVIEVVGTRAQQTQKIDRRTYRVNQTPHSAQKDSIQLLRGLPAVTVSPDDDVMLLGSGNVRIFIDGRPYAGDPKQYLRTLHGSDIERIEIITNPSAQYSAEGTGGIINFVLREKRDEGTSGNVYSEVTGRGHGNAGASVKTKRGKWTYEFETGGRAGNDSRSTYRKLRSTEETPGGMLTINTETGGGPRRGTEGEASAKVTYELDQRTSVSAKIQGAAWHDTSTNDAEFEGLTPDFESFSERQRFATKSSLMIGYLNFDHKGVKEGETLSASLRVFASPTQHETNAASFSNGGALSTDKLKRFLFGTGQVDWQHPMGKGQILSIGGTWDFSHMSERYRFASSGGEGLGSDARDQFKGIDNTLAGYVTFQQPIGSWTVMPGVRVERNNRRISSPGHPDVRIEHTNLFPTVHVDHSLSKRLDLTLSYSKRIDRPSLNDLRPYGIVQDVLTIKQGNPRLKDQSTDAYEINLHYHRGKFDAGIIAYDREKSEIWSNSYFVNAEGVSVFTLVNAGHIRDRGAEIDVSMPLVKRVKVNASVNLFDERAPIDAAVDSRSEDKFRYTTNTTLEWDGPDRGKVPGDIAQLQWGYDSPSRQVQFHYFASSFQSLSYTHSFNRTLSLTGTINHVSHVRHEVLAPLVQEYFEERSPLEFKLKLLKTFGKP